MKSLYQSILFACLLCISEMGVAEDEARPLPKFTVSEDTTFITEPLTKEGFPHYARWLNEMHSEGVSATNNANVLFWQAYGPHPQGESMPAEFFELMLMETPSETGEYFADLEPYLKEKRAPADRIRRALDQHESTYEKPWKAEDQIEISGWLKANEAPLALVIAGTKRPKFFSPIIDSANDEVNHGLIGSPAAAPYTARAVARALMTRAMLRVGEGETELAWQDLLTVHRLARFMSQGSTLDEVMIGIGMETAATNGDVLLLEHSQLSRRQIETFQRDLNELTKFPVMAEIINICERFRCLDAMLLLESSNPRHAAATTMPDGSPRPAAAAIKALGNEIDWDTVLKMSNGWYDRYVKAMREPNRSRRVELFAELDRDLDGMMKQVSDRRKILRLIASPDKKKAGELICGILLGTFLPAIRSAVDADDRNNQQYRHLQLAMALAAYHADHDRYPKELDELVAQYIAEVPGDLFTGKPLIYRSSDDGYLLYSLGLNGEDDGGNSYPSPGDDITVRVPSQE